MIELYLSCRVSGIINLWRRHSRIYRPDIVLHAGAKKFSPSCWKANCWKGRYLEEIIIILGKLKGSGYWNLIPLEVIGWLRNGIGYWIFFTGIRGSGEEP